MQHDSPKYSALAKLVVCYGVFSCIVQAATYLLGAGTSLYFGPFHLALTLLYMALSLLFTLHCLRTGSRNVLVLDATCWLATLLLTLPALLAELGLLAADATPAYQWILFPVASQFFGLMPWMNNASVFGLTIAFSVLELGILSGGAYHKKLLQ